MKDKPSIIGSWPLARRLLKTYVRPQAKGIAVAMLLMLISAGMTAALAQLLEPIIDKVFSAKDRTMLLPVGLAVIGVFTVRGLAIYGQTVMMNQIGQRIICDMQKGMFAHLLRADVAYFHQQQSGALQSRFISDTTMLRGALNEALAGFGRNTFMLIFLLAVMFRQDWKLSLMCIFVFPVAGYIVALVGKKIRKVGLSTLTEVGGLNSLLGQAFQGNRHIKAYGMEGHEQERIGGALETIYRLNCKSFRTAAIATPLSEILSGLAVVAVVVYGGHQAITGATTAGKLFSFIAAFLMAFEPMKRLAKLNGITQLGLAAAERMFSLLDIEPEIRDRPGAVALRASAPTVMFENVSFSYADGAEALRGVSFEVPAGKTVALVGASGAGKSTILNLIPRFYDVTGGSIRVGGQDVRDVTLESLRASMALVSQEVAIFNDTVRDNIAYGTAGAAMEDIVSAAKAAAAHDFIMELPNGYDTLVGENGVKLSGGQRQRISIARAFLRNAPILLLDEATSALDTESERLVQAALERLQKGKTTIVVAHRLSTIMNADIIYVMADGRVIETGNHAGLIEKSGAYARLYGSLMREAG